MESTIIKNDKQLFFNQVRGEVEEINRDDQFSNITLKVGHDNSRNVNLVSKTKHFESVASNIKIGDKVTIRYYLSSRKKHDRWYTTANILDIHKDM